MAGVQKNLFGDADAPWEEDAASEALAATVVFTSGPEQEFSYLVPDRLAGRVEPGRRVKVPLGRGNRPMLGYCVAVEPCRVPSRKLKSVSDVIDDQALLSPAMMRLARWIGEYYLCPLGQVLEAVLPAGVRTQAGTRVATLLSVPDEVRARLPELKLPTKQAQVLEHLADSKVPLSAKQLTIAARCTNSPVNALLKKGLIEAHRQRVDNAVLTELPVTREDGWELTPEQQQAFDAILAPIRDARHETLLLAGVTGSGKTEVYIRAIHEVVSYGRQAIVLVPEISLTPQTTERFRARFEQVAVLHSHLSDAERHRHWQRIARGEVQVVVGARSAVFAPTPHLGLIVIDEEHEASFKQESAPRYHARDVALVRARAERVPLVLGSATPALESWQRAQTGEYRLLRMPKRVMNRPLPAVGTIDLREDVRSKVYRGAIGRKLGMAMTEALEDGGQVILLLNRRGFSTHIQCPACGHVVRCPACEIALTYHRDGEHALCHYCDYEIETPTRCEECSFQGIRFSGLGTQKLEAEVRGRFPNYTCARMDTDAMRRPGSHERTLAAFRAGDVRILLGTQMIAKGLDFPSVTLVGVVNADTALHLPDFRAGERTFQLLAQVAGRTGRGEMGGRVLVQTFEPEHPAIKAAVRHDYETFAAGELPMREALGYPPFASMVRLIVRGPQEATAMAFAGELADRLRGALSDVERARVLGPVPAPIARLRGKHRFHVLANAPGGDALRAAVLSVSRNVTPPDEVHWVADIDPLGMM